MTPKQVARHLAAVTPGRQNDLPTPMRKGTRCSVTVGEITAYGTIVRCYGSPDNARAVVQLDGDGAVEVDVSWNLIGKGSYT